MKPSSDKYEILKGQFWCQECSAVVATSRYYPATLELTWKCRECDNVSYVCIEKKRGY